MGMAFFAVVYETLAIPEFFSVGSWISVFLLMNLFFGNSFILDGDLIPGRASNFAPKRCYGAGCVCLQHGGGYSAKSKAGVWVLIHAGGRANIRFKVASKPPPPKNKFINKNTEIQLPTEKSGNGKSFIYNGKNAIPIEKWGLTLPEENLQPPQKKTAAVKELTAAGLPQTFLPHNFQ